MKIERRFLIAPSLVRLIERERLPTRSLVEGYFQPLPDRTHFVQIETEACRLVLQTLVDVHTTEQRATIPAPQADALLDVCAGKIGYRRTSIQLDGTEALLERFQQPKGVDLLLLQFDDQVQADTFTPREWFGAEITHDASYTKQSLAVTGAPSPVDVEATNTVVLSLLDTLDANTRERLDSRTGENSVVAAFTRAEVFYEGGAAMAEPDFGPRPATFEPLEGQTTHDVVAGLAQALGQTSWPMKEQEAEERAFIPLRKRLRG